MSCACKKKADDLGKGIGPEDNCLICAQKHVTQARRALNEFGYEEEEDNHDFAIGELGLAICHLEKEYRELAERIRKARRYVQYWEYGKPDWKGICRTLNREIRKILKESRSKDWRIYVFSNVEYPEKNKIDVQERDILVFLNKAVNIDYYAEHRGKIIYHRSPDENYGQIVNGCMNRYVFNKSENGHAINQDFINGLKKTYDWNYEIEEGKVKSMTTGYMVVKWLERQYGKERLVLVNFGYDVKNSTYRCPWHNWKFEAEQLKDFEHVSTEERERRETANGRT